MQKSKHFPGWDLATLQRLKADGKIAGISEPEPETPKGKIVGKHFKKRSKEKDHIAWVLWDFCSQNSLKLFEEYVFDETGQRAYRFDWCIPDQKIAIEYEGIFADKSGHTTIGGYSKDVQKYNLATHQGWRLIRLTAMDYKTLSEQLKILYKPNERS